MITQTSCTVFQQNLLNGNENFTTGTYKIALYTGLANLNQSTTAYSSTNEVVGTGYTAGGQVLTISTPPTQNSQYNVTYVSFNNVTWSPASFTANSALIYNATTNAAVCVLNFGSDKVATNSFTITFPVDDASTAVIRIA